MSRQLGEPWSGSSVDSLVRYYETKETTLDRVRVHAAFMYIGRTLPTRGFRYGIVCDQRNDSDERAGQKKCQNLPSNKPA